MKTTVKSSGKPQTKMEPPKGPKWNKTRSQRRNARAVRRGNYTHPYD